MSMIVRVVLAVAALVADWLLQVWAGRNLDSGVAVLGDRVVTEQTLNILQLLLLVTAVLLIASALFRFARIVLTGLAGVALVAVVLVGSTVPDGVESWIRDNGCRESLVETSQAIREACQ